MDAIEEQLMAQVEQEQWAVVADCRDLGIRIHQRYGMIGGMKGKKETRK